MRGISEALFSGTTFPLHLYGLARVSPPDRKLETSRKVWGVCGWIALGKA